MQNNNTSLNNHRRNLSAFFTWMRKVKLISDNPCDGVEAFEQIDVAAFSKKTFGMFAGEERTVRLIVDSYLAGAMIDRFGQDVALRKIDDKRVQVRANVAVSPHFFGWITGFGKGIRIEYPEDVALEYKKYITEILEKY